MVATVVGDNNKSSIPDSPFGFHPAAIVEPGYPANGYIDAKEIGIKWYRPGTNLFWFKVQPDLDSTEYDFTFYDRKFGLIPEDSGVLANIAPETQDSDQGRLLEGSWMPINMAQYEDFVKASVERYDGDGIDDMPGLVNPVLYWQVSNEPNALLRSDFSVLQKITYQAIKQACLECKVVIGGVSGFNPEGYVQGFNERYVPILEELDGQYIDVFDFHWYGNATGEYRMFDSEAREDVLGYVRDSLVDYGFPPDLPIWITEMGSYSGDTSDNMFHFQTERQQAMDYFKRFIYPLSRGIEKVFIAFGLIEGFKDTDSYFDHTGLIYDGQGSNDLGLGIKKLSYYTYKKMTESLEGADWSTLITLRDGTDTDHLYLFQVEKDGKPIHIAWWDYFDEPQYASSDMKRIVLNGLTGDELIVTSVIPYPESGIEVTDYANSFASSAHRIVNGSAMIFLHKDPVIIVEQSS